jgi:SAM-dependent methyltransferase
MPLDRNQRTSFDRAARLYDEVRPGYPDELIADAVALSGVPAGGRILEIGCGTGQATLPFARRGYRMLCLDIGPEMAAVAAENLRPFPGVEVRALAFEDWEPAGETFDLVISGTAFHWVDQRVGIRKAAAALRPDGGLALFWNLHANKDAPFFRAAQEVYRRHAPQMEMPRGGRTKAQYETWFDSRAEKIRSGGLFKDVVEKRYSWSVEYDAGQYLRLLGTYSDHLSLGEAARRDLFAGLSGLIAKSGGTVRMEYLTILYVGRR